MKNLFSVLLRLLPLLAIGLGAYLWANHEWDTSRVESPEEAKRSLSRIGEMAKDFSLPTLNDPKQQLRLESLKGQGILLNFWATWCGPCVKELPSLIAVAKEYRERGLRVVAVSVDRDWATIDRFLARHPELKSMKDELIVVLDANSAVAEQYSVDRYPESFLIHRSFKVELRLSGEQAWEDPRFKVYYDRILQ